MKVIGPASEAEVAASMSFQMYVVGSGSWIAEGWSNWPGDRMIQLPWTNKLTPRPYLDGIVWE